MISSISYDQNEIIQNILNLLELERFDVDISYGNGGFYKEIDRPYLKFDIDPQAENVIKACSTRLPIEDQKISSVVFDPPFLTYIKAAREHNSIMAKRFGGYWSYDELEEHYKQTINEVYRITKPKGYFIFKCQDIIHNHKLHPTHINIVNWSDGMFRLKDMFILAAKHRMAMPQQEGTKTRKQKHARIFHSYFLVLQRI